MRKELAKIEFYFPEGRNGIKNKQRLADSILDMMRKRGSTAYAGSLDEAGIYEGIVQHLGDADISQYKPLSKSQRKEIQKQIKEIIQKCDNYLPIPVKNYIFVFPYLPTEKDSAFEGVMGVARYSCVFHIFLSLDFWSPKALVDTVAHELNHTIFYYYHYDDFNNYTLLDEMIIEGLAENFREQVTGGMPTPWAVALAQEEAFDTLDSVNRLLSSKDNDIHRDILFGNDEYKRWAGYSMGYWIVKELIHKRPDLSWEKIMKLNSKEILEIAKK